MDVNLAVDIAATTDEDLTANLVRQVVASFLGQLVRCTVCNDTGQFTYGRNTTLRVVDKKRQHEPAKEEFIEAGTVGPCPRCGEPIEEGKGRFDPDWVQWLCTGRNYDRCTEDIPALKDGHDDCGYRIVLPVDIADRIRPPDEAADD